MLNLRMIGIASALLLLLPAGMAATDDQRVFEASGEVIVYVNEIAVGTIGNLGPYEDETLMEEEQLVEGHTVFVTIGIERNRTQANASFEVVGNVSCEYEIHGDGFLLLGLIPFYNRIYGTSAQCKFGDRVVVAPDPFAAFASTHYVSPTGRIVQIAAADGQTTYAEEFSATVFEERANGDWEEKTYYAWAVPLLAPVPTPALHGGWANLVLPLPEDRLREMGPQEYRILHESDILRA